MIDRSKHKGYQKLPNGTWKEQIKFS